MQAHPSQGRNHCLESCVGEWSEPSAGRVTSDMFEMRMMQGMQRSKKGKEEALPFVSARRRSGPNPFALKCASCGRQACSTAQPLEGRGFAWRSCTIGPRSICTGHFPCSLAKKFSCQAPPAQWTPSRQMICIEGYPKTYCNELQELQCSWIATSHVHLISTSMYVRTHAWPLLSTSLTSCIQSLILYQNGIARNDCYWFLRASCVIDQWHVSQKTS